MLILMLEKPVFRMVSMSRRMVWLWFLPVIFWKVSGLKLSRLMLSLLNPASR